MWFFFFFVFCEILNLNLTFVVCRKLNLSNVYLASDASSCKMKLYALQQDVTSATKKARAMWFDTDVFDPLIFTEEAEREISVKDTCSSLKESFVNDKIIEMTENEFIRT